MMPLFARQIFAMITALLLCATAQTAHALEVPPLRSRVTDLAGVLDPSDREAIEAKLRSYERQTGHQFAILIVPSLQGDSLDDYSLRVVDAWKLGKAKNDDGLLLLIAMAERRMRIEVGYGLEGSITDALSSQVIRNVLQPAFKQQDFSGGIDKALNLLMKAGSGEAIDPTMIQQPAARPEPSGTPLLPLLLLVFFFLIFGGRGGAGFILGSMLGGGRWSSRRGGGSSGGGGRFGGGGASGGW